MMDESEIRQRFAQLREADRERHRASLRPTPARARAGLANDAARASARDRRGGGRRDRGGLDRECATVLASHCCHADDRGHRSMARADGRPTPDSRQRAARRDARARRVRARQNDSHTFKERNLTMRHSILAFAFVLGAASLAAQGPPMGQRSPSGGPDDTLGTIGSLGAGDAAPERDRTAGLAARGAHVRRSAGAGQVHGRSVEDDAEGEKMERLLRVHKVDEAAVLDEVDRILQSGAGDQEGTNFTDGTHQEHAHGAAAGEAGGPRARRG